MKKIQVDPKDARVLRVREAVERYRIGRTRLYELMRTGALRSTTVGRTRLIPVDALDELLGAAGPLQRQPS